MKTPDNTQENADSAPVETSISTESIAPAAPTIPPVRRRNPTRPVLPRQWELHKEEGFKPFYYRLWSFPKEVYKGVAYWKVTVRPSRMVEGLTGLDWEAGCTLGLTAVRTVSLVCSNRRGHPLPVGAATSAAALARLSRHPRGVSFQISRCGWLDNRGTMSHR